MKIAYHEPWAATVDFGKHLIPRRLVALYVWSLAKNEERWSEAQDISTPHGFSAAFERLQRDLESQRMVWIRGNFLPGDIRVDEAAPMMLLASSHSR